MLVSPCGMDKEIKMSNIKEMIDTLKDQKYIPLKARLRVRTLLGLKFWVTTVGAQK